MSTITPETRATLDMLARRPRPAPTVGRMKKPVGGRPNPVLAHADIFEEKARIRANIIKESRIKKRAFRRENTTPEAVLVRRLVDAVLSGDLPAGPRLTARDVYRAMGRKVHCGLEILATKAAAAGAPVRLRCRGGAGKAYYVVEIL